MSLTPRQQRFVDEYLIDLNATQAAIRAGYSAKTAEQQGPRLLGNVEVAAAVQVCMNRRSERTEIDQDFVLQGIVKNIRRCEQGEVVYDKSGAPLMVATPDGELAAMYRYESTSALRGYELLGKHLKLFTDKIDHSSEDGSMTPKGLADFYAEPAHT